ncbi:hypothetical protein ACSQ67_024932 [Phaseolus vulgaris]
MLLCLPLVDIHSLFSLPSFATLVCLHFSSSIAAPNFVYLLSITTTLSKIYFFFAATTFPLRRHRSFSLVPPFFSSVPPFFLFVATNSSVVAPPYSHHITLVPRP